MKRKITRGGAAAFGIVLGVLFGIAPGGAAASSQGGRDDVAGPVTVTGCLIEFSAADGEQFVLANVKPTSPSEVSADADATDLHAAAKAVRRYLVMEQQVDELRKHVMHQVEMSGTLVPRSTLNLGRALDDLPRLYASSIRPLAGACTPPGSED